MWGVIAIVLQLATFGVVNLILRGVSPAIEAGQSAAVITLPDSIAWLLNIRGSDIPRNPVPQGFAILQDDGGAALFTDPAKLDADTRAHLGDAVTVAPPEDCKVRVPISKRPSSYV